MLPPSRHRRSAPSPASPTVHLAPGELHISFQRPQELLEQLYQLSQTIAQDFPAFEAITRK